MAAWIGLLTSLTLIDLASIWQFWNDNLVVMILLIVLLLLLIGWIKLGLIIRSQDDEEEDDEDEDEETFEPEPPPTLPNTTEIPLFTRDYHPPEETKVLC